MSDGKPAILLVPYRWGSDLVGGAETLHRRLAVELRDLGCHVAVWTTTAHRFRPFCHWGNVWEEFLPQGTTVDEGIPVTRFPALKYPRAVLGLLAKSIQRDWEQNQPRPSGEAIGALDRPTLGPGWHEAESFESGRVRRWSAARAELLLPSGTAACNLRIEGTAPWTVRVRLRDPDGRLLMEERLRGEFAVECAITGSPGTLILEVSGARRPLREFRTLGFMASRITLGGTEFRMWEDWRRLLADADWWECARRRPRWADMFFDALRGPNSPALVRALATHANKFDVVVSMNLPWRLFVPPQRRGGPVRGVLPLIHPGDGYYYWRHYADTLRGVDLIAAMSEGSAASMLRSLNASTAVIGAPVWPHANQAGPRKGRGRVNILTVCRKVPEKGYRSVAESVARLRAGGLDVSGRGVGPDHDRWQPPSDFNWEGVVPGDRLRELYAESDIFVLMSESESFGMVVVEAWHAGLPVVVNRHCRALASLVRDGVDGILAAPGAECDAAISRLARSAELRRSLGEAGRERALREFVRGACGTRLLDALGPLVAARRGEPRRGAAT